MKKVLFSLVLFSFLILPLISLAQPYAPYTPPRTIQGTLPEGIPDIRGHQIEIILIRVGDWMFTFLLVVAVIMIVASGFLFITAAGDAEKVKKARNLLIYALVGVAVALLANGLIALVRMVIGA